MSEENSVPDEPTVGLELQLQEIDGLTPDQILNPEPVKLPLSDEDRKRIENTIRKKQNWRLSLIEMMLLMMMLCVLMGLTRWLPFEIYTVALGCVAVILLLFDKLLSPRYRTLTIGVILSAYLISAAFLIVTG